MAKLTYNKLVRDRIPEIIAEKGKKSSTRKLSDDEYSNELMKKLDEEIDELKKDLSIEELADVLEVVYAIADEMDSREDLEKVRSEKAKKRGAFKDKIFLESVEE